MAGLLVELPGRPVPLARPHTTRNGGRRHADSTRDHCERLRDTAAVAAMQQRWKVPPRAARLKASITIRPELTKSGNTPAPRSRGDLDNHIKAVLDALRGPAFEDDDQVVEIFARFGAASLDGATIVLIEIQD